MTTKTVDRQWCLLVISKQLPKALVLLNTLINHETVASSPLYLQGLSEFLIPG